MWRFGKTRPKELWEEEVQSPLGDIEAAAAKITVQGAMYPKKLEQMTGR